MTAKRYLMSTALVMSLAYMPVAAQEQQILQKDSTTNTKEEKNRNVMLNASNNDRPRDISIGLPASFGITIFEDGLPVSYSSWPCLPFKSWAGGVGQGEVKLMSLGEAALRNGTVGYIVDSYVKDGSDKFKGNVNYSLNHFGRQVLDLALTGSFGKGWGYNAWTYQTADPGTYSMKNTHLQDRTQIYKLGISKTWNDGRGIMSAFFKYAHSRNWADSYAPFYYETDGSITQLDGFTPGRNSYLPSDGRIDYIDPITGEAKTKDLGDGGSIDKALEVNFRLKYTYTNGNQLTIASKYRDATTDQSNNICVGIANTADGAPKTSPKYYYWDGRLFNGNYQNRMIRQVDGDEKSWMTNAQLTGKGGNHAWRVGFDLRYNKHGYTAAGTFFAHEVKADPERFYMKDANGNLVRSWLFNKSAEYCDGHETKVALYASDDWDISRHFWLSAGVRLEYFNACGYAANNVDGATNNSRTIGWYLNNGTATKTRFNKDYLNPSVDVNAPSGQARQEGCAVVCGLCGGWQG